MNSPWWFLLTALAVWRVVVFVRQDGLIEGTRDRVSTWLLRRDENIVAAKALFLISCQWCLSIWFALGATIWWAIDGHMRPIEFVITWLALAATASTFDLIADHL